MREFIELLYEFKNKRSFAIRGLPLTKKLWRDGYNKAIEDMIYFVEMKQDERKG
jgi:hypothetical protein